MRPLSIAHVMCQSWNLFTPYTPWSTVAMRVWNHQLFAPSQLASMDGEWPLLDLSFENIMWRMESIP